MDTQLKERETLWKGGSVTPSLCGVRADNFSPMTVTGTNTFIVHAPGTPLALVVDPGPADVGHLRAVMAACEERGARIGGILVTHHHLDHIEGTDLLRHMVAEGPASVEDGAIPEELSGKRFAFDDSWNYPRVTFPEAGVPVFHSEMGNCPAGPFEPFEGCPALEIVPLPGHSYDSVGLLLRDERAILTGDLIFRDWSSIVPHADGDLGDYLGSLDRLQQLVESGLAELLVPAHGFPIDQPIETIEGYRAHRHERLAQVRAVIDAGAGFDPDAVIEGVYGDLTDETLLVSALSSTIAQLRYLAAEYGVDFDFTAGDFARHLPARSHA